MDSPRSGPGAPPDLILLAATEQEELALLLGVAWTAACARCGRSGLDVTRLNDEQKRRTLALLRGDARAGEGRS